MAVFGIDCEWTILSYPESERGPRMEERKEEKITGYDGMGGCKWSCKREPPRV